LATGPRFAHSLALVWTHGDAQATVTGPSVAIVCSAGAVLAVLAAAPRRATGRPPRVQWRGDGLARAQESHVPAQVKPPDTDRRSGAVTR